MGVVKIYVLGVYNNYNIISFMEILHKHQILMFLLFVQNSCKDHHFLSSSEQSYLPYACGSGASKRASNSSLVIFSFSIRRLALACKTSIFSVIIFLALL